jgi:3-polyprenyl-4-hydroxybenzoate decarboxylase
VHDFPVFHCETLLRRADAIVPATVVGKPRQEDFFLGDFVQELLAPLFPVVMPSVVQLWSYGETGYHPLAAAVVRDRYKREAMVSAFRILGEGQLSLTKFLLLTDRPVELRDFKALLEHVLARARIETDLFVLPNLSMDTLDYAGAKLNEGSKGVLLGLGDPIRELPREFRGELPAGFPRAAVFCGGCLVVAAPPFAQEAAAAERAARKAPSRPGRSSSSPTTSRARPRARPTSSGPRSPASTRRATSTSPRARSSTASWCAGRRSSSTRAASRISPPSSSATRRRAISSRAAGATTSRRGGDGGLRSRASRRTAGVS